MAVSADAYGWKRSTAALSWIRPRHAGNAASLARPTDRRTGAAHTDHFSAVSSPSRKGRNGNERRTADACTNSAYGIVPEQPIGYVTLRQRIELRRAIENGPVKDRHILSDEEWDRHQAARKPRHVVPYIRERGREPQSVYFIQAGCGSIKIGIAANVKARLANLQTATPSKLTLLATREGGAVQEAASHAQLLRPGANANGSRLPAAHIPASSPGNAIAHPRTAAAFPSFYEMLDARVDRTHPDHAEISEWLDGYDPEELDVFPIQIALGRFAARRNAAAKRIMKPAND